MLPPAPPPAAAPAGEDARTRDYLRGRGLEAAGWLGASPELLERSEELAESLFRRFSARQPTEADRAKVFPLATAPGDPPGTLRWDEDRADLLRYAFEQAALSGHGGNWPYIEGVLQRLGRREIATLADAEGYELARVP